MPACRDCGRPLRKRTNQPGYVGANGRCGSCDDRWRRHGCPEECPPPMTHADRTARSARAFRKARARRQEEYARSRDTGLTVAQAAAETGIAVSTARRFYEPSYWLARHPEEDADAA